MLSEENIEFFKAEVKRFMRKYGVSTWDVRIDTCKFDDGTRALVDYQYGPRSALIRVDIGDDAAREDLSRSALHEVLHLLFTDMREAYMHLSPDAPESEPCLSAEHGVITAISNMEFGDAE